MIEIAGTPYSFHEARLGDLEDLAHQVRAMRAAGKLKPAVVEPLRPYFRIKNIFHSNAIEGNQLDAGETRLVVEEGLTLTGKPLKDQAEARNLSHALDYLEKLASETEAPIIAKDVKEMHALVLEGIEDHAGAYRTGQVKITGSKFLPPGPEKLHDELEVLFGWLRGVSAPGEEHLASTKGLLAAAAAHTWLVTIHPFTDGNGRVGRLLLNLVLMRYRFPVGIVSREDRHRYYDALEESQGGDLTPFLALLAECMRESLEKYEQAAEDQRQRSEWARELMERVTEPERIQAGNEYEVWKNAMELFRSFLHRTADDLTTNLGRVWVKDFGHVDSERYTTMRSGAWAKKTWFCGLAFRSGDREARYLFFFGPASSYLRGRCDVTLHVAREEPPGSQTYKRLNYLKAPNVPQFWEIGYDVKQEQFVLRGPKREASGRIEMLGRTFFEDVLLTHFKK